MADFLTSARDLSLLYDLDGIVSFIQTVGAQRVSCWKSHNCQCGLNNSEIVYEYMQIALQFPDERLADAPEVASLLQERLQALNASKTIPSTTVAAQDCGSNDCSCKQSAPEVNTKVVVDEYVVAVLGDTTFGACCVDEVAAKHMNCDCVVHIGHSCMSSIVADDATTITEPEEADAGGSKTRGSHMHVYHVFPPEEINAENAGKHVANAIRGLEGDQRAFLMFEPSYWHSIPAILRATAVELTDIIDAKAESEIHTNTSNSSKPASDTHSSVFSSSLVSPHEKMIVPTFHWANNSAANVGKSDKATSGFFVAGMHFPTSISSENNDIIIHIGHRDARLRMLVMQFASVCVMNYNPLLPEESTFQLQHQQQQQLITQRWQRIPIKRLMATSYMHVESVRNAGIIGLVAGTLGVARHTNMLHALRNAIVAAGKHCYTLMVGKLSAVKLGNFPEVDVFVLIACPETTVLGDTIKDYAKSVVTPQEALIALEAGPEWTGNAAFAFSDVLQKVDVDLLKVIAAAKLSANATATDDTEEIDGTAAFSLDKLNNQADSDATRMMPSSEEKARGGSHTSNTHTAHDADGSSSTSPHAVAAPPSTAITVHPYAGGASTALVKGKFYSPASVYASEKRTWVGLQYEITTPTNEAGKATAATTTGITGITTTTGMPSTKIVEGQKGIAAGYDSEPKVRG